METSKFTDRILISLVENEAEISQMGRTLPICEIPVWHIPSLCVQCKTQDDGQRNCPKHVEFYSKNKFEKLVPLVGFIIRKSFFNLGAIRG